MQGGRPHRRRGRKASAQCHSGISRGRRARGRRWPRHRAVKLHGRFHDSHDSDLGLRFPRDVDTRRLRPSAAPPEHGGKVFGDDRHLGDVAPVRRDEFAALPEVEPQDLEKSPLGGRAHEKRPQPVLDSQVKRLGVRGPQKITTRQNNWLPNPDRLEVHKNRDSTARRPRLREASTHGREAPHRTRRSRRMKSGAAPDRTRPSAGGPGPCRAAHQDSSGDVNWNAAASRPSESAT